MDEEKGNINYEMYENRKTDVVYDQEKDFYRGISGELRYKAEGLFKKAKEKGISIEEVSIATLREREIEFPGVGAIQLPAYVVKVRGRHIQSGRVLVDAKQIDYYNRYQSYVADKLMQKNYMRDEKGNIVKKDNKPEIKREVELGLNDWERFEVARNILDDKEFGLEKTITGACDRVIRKLMGENDWLYPEEARLLDEEFNNVQEKIAAENENRRQDYGRPPKKATDRQINYLKARIRSMGADPEDSSVIKEILKRNGYETMEIKDLSTVDMSKIIDSLSSVMPRIINTATKPEDISATERGDFSINGENIKQ